MNYSSFNRLQASFRDPSGYIFIRGGRIFRAITFSYKDNYDSLISSGLYNRLTDEGLLVSHIQVNELTQKNPNIYKIIQPQEITFISYPYEWSFSQLKDAALLTLRIQKISLEHGMTLKDATAFNIQFYDGKPVFIDTLSFEKYTEAKPWVAYRQFCMNFLAPLLLMKYKDLRMNKLLSIFIDGIPLDLTRKLLPFKSFLNFSIFSHIYLHSLSERYSKAVDNNRNVRIPKYGIPALIENLEKTIIRIKLKHDKSVWRDYYFDNSYSKLEFQEKKKIVKEYLEIINPTIIADLGANTGIFSRFASDKKVYTISCDFDPHCVEFNYLDLKQKQEKSILPLFIDLANPSPNLGWNNLERDSFLKRNKVDAIMALAIIHHLSITNNVPFEDLVSCFSQMSKYLIIEFVPKEDIQVKSLLANRRDIFENYNSDYFEKVFEHSYEIVQKNVITQSGRTLYLMKLK